jgi:hypothetical protein
LIPGQGGESNGLAFKAIASNKSAWLLQVDFLKNNKAII